MDTVTRISKYIHARFPLYQFLPLSYLIGYTVWTHTNANIIYLHITSLSFLLFLLTIRIVDERLDLKHDKKYHPERPLPSGRVKKEDLDLILIFSILSQVLLILIVNVSLFVVLTAVFIYLYIFLMKKDFFIQNLNQKSFLGQTLMHELITIFIVFFLFFINKHQLNIETILISFLIMSVLFLLEISRKYSRSNREPTTYLYELGRNKTFLIHLLLSLIILSTSFYLGQNTIFLYLAILGFVFIALNIVYSKLKKKIYSKTLFMSSIFFCIFSLLSIT